MVMLANERLERLAKLKAQGLPPSKALAALGYSANSDGIFYREDIRKRALELGIELMEAFIYGEGARAMIDLATSPDTAPQHRINAFNAVATRVENARKTELVETALTITTYQTSALVGALEIILADKIAAQNATQAPTIEHGELSDLIE